MFIHSSEGEDVTKNIKNEADQISEVNNIVGRLILKKKLT